MRKSLALAFCAAFWCGLFFQGCAGFKPFLKASPEKQTCLDLALHEALLERQDFTIAYDKKTLDPFSLNRVFSFLQSPVQLISNAEHVEHEIQKSSGSLAALIKFSGAMLEQPAEDAALPNIPAEFQVPGLPPAVKDIYEALVKASRLFAQAYAGLSREEAGFVKDTVERLLFEGEYRGDLSRKETRDVLERAFLLAARIDMRKIVQACFIVAREIDRSLPEIKKGSGLPAHESRVLTPLGDIVIGSTGKDTHGGAMPLLLIDPGGNDTYAFKDYKPLSVIIDAAGNDSYVSTASSFLGAGVLGLGFLIDLEGDDQYQGDIYSFGCGFMGAGVAADFAGNDRYVSRMFCQGAAALGLGLLYDKEGDDFYQSELYSQGMGYVGGAGMLIDMKGNDVTVSGSAVPDAREQAGAFQTYSQGFGLGCRQYASGGVGLLYNGEGNDTYQGSYFCQGSSYWRALGLLIDSKGDDRYTARRYSQGSGIHSSAGALYDRSGSDVYTSWGVSQGCGHDYAVGLLYDAKGDDRYEAAWLSQGAGSSTGIGVLIDDGGEDAYKAGGGNNQGTGAYDERRDGESIGIFIDREGDDVLPENLKGKTLWRQGDIGAGIDDTGARRAAWHEAAQDDVFSHPYAAPLAPEEKKGGACEQGLLPELEAPLFLEDSWEKASASLADKGPSIIPALCSYLAIKDASVQRTIEETFKKLGKTSVEAIHDFLKRVDTGVETKRFLLYALGDMGNKKTKDVFLSFISYDDGMVQAMAVRGLYKLHEPVQPDMAERLHESGSSAVRKYLCLALQASDDMPAVKLLCEMLTDADFQVRHAARRALKEKKEAARSFLLELQARRGLLPSVHAMVAELLEGSYTSSGEGL